MRRSASARRDQFLDSILCAGEQGFDVTIIAIADPAVHAEPLRFLQNESPKTHALHVARDAHPDDLLVFTQYRALLQNEAKFLTPNDDALQ